MPLPKNLSMATETLASSVLIMTWLLVMRSVRYSKWQLAMISLPGTVTHELLHCLMGLLLFAKPRSFSILPKRQDDTLVLGSVGFSNLNIWNAAPVAFAPFLMLGIGWLLFEHWMLPNFQIGNYLIWVASGYITACSLFSCIPSATDFEVGAWSGLMYGCIGLGIWYFWQ